MDMPCPKSSCYSKSKLQQGKDFSAGQGSKGSISTRRTRKRCPTRTARTSYPEKAQKRVVSEVWLSCLPGIWESGVLGSGDLGFGDLGSGDLRIRDLQIWDLKTLGIWWDRSGDLWIWGIYFGRHVAEARASQFGLHILGWLCV